MNQPNYDVFISHAWEDKEAVARPLARLLERMGLSVWYDEALLRPGDSLSSRVDEGLANARFGVVVLSKSFFDKDWPKYELSGLKTRQIRGEQIIIPIWHDITIDDILTHSPPLADLLGLKTADGPLEEIARAIFYLVSKESYSPWLMSKGDDIFASCGEAVHINEQGKSYSLIAGVKSLYEQLRNIVNYAEIVRRFGRSVFASGPHSDTSLNLYASASFGHYSPDFVAWLGRHVRLFLSNATFVKATQPVYSLSRDSHTTVGRTSPFSREGWKVCNRRLSPVAARPGEGPFTEPTPAVRPRPRERVFLPRSGPLSQRSGRHPCSGIP
jgi:hypothetical protein